MWIRDADEHVRLPLSVRSWLGKGRDFLAQWPSCPLLLLFLALVPHHYYNNPLWQQDTVPREPTTNLHLSQAEVLISGLILQQDKTIARLSNMQQIFVQLCTLKTRKEFLKKEKRHQPESEDYYFFYA